MEFIRPPQFPNCSTTMCMLWKNNETDEYKQKRDPNKATSQDKKGKETKIATGAKRRGITTCKAGK